MEYGRLMHLFSIVYPFDNSGQLVSVRLDSASSIVHHVLTVFSDASLARVCLSAPRDLFP